MAETKWNVAPLSSGFMLTSIIGFLISTFYLYPLNKTWGFTMALMFVIMFLASMLSMTVAPVGFSHVAHHQRKKR